MALRKEVQALLVQYAKDPACSDRHKEFIGKAVRMLRAGKFTDEELETLEMEPTPLLLGGLKDLISSIKKGARDSELLVMKAQLKVLTDQHKVLTDQQKVLIDKQMLTNEVIGLVFEYSEENATASTNAMFKHTIVTKYSHARAANEVARSFGQQNLEYIYCMVLHVYLPKFLVIATHLWKRAWHKFAHLVSIEVHDWRNGLLLFKPIKWAFDSSRLVFRKVEDTYKVIIMDESILQVQLVDKLLELKPDISEQNMGIIRACVGTVTFGDLNGRALMSDGSEAPQPYSRILHFHAKRALDKAIKKGWAIPEDARAPPTDSGSPGIWQVNVQRLFDSVEQMNVPSAAPALATAAGASASSSSDRSATSDSQEDASDSQEDASDSQEDALSGKGRQEQMCSLSVHQQQDPPAACGMPDAVSPPSSLLAGSAEASLAGRGQQLQHQHQDRSPGAGCSSTSRGGSGRGSTGRSSAGRGRGGTDRGSTGRSNSGGMEKASYASVLKR